MAESKVNFNDELIEFFGGKERVPTVKGRYTVNTKLITNQDDAKIFKDLFDVRPNTNTGKGELALYWLLGGMRDPDVKSTGSGFAADLQINDNVNIEVKAYDSKNVKIGRFERQKEFLDLVGIIFSVYNLVTPNQKTFSLMKFDYDDLVEAADEFCLLRQAIFTLLNSSSFSSQDKDKLADIKLFQGVEKRALQFDSFASRYGLENICFIGAGEKRVGGEMIAKSLLRFITESTLMEKPGGRTGYMAILPTKFDTNSKMQFIKVIENGRIDLTEDKMRNIHKHVTFSGGAMHINFEALFS